MINTKHIFPSYRLVVLAVALLQVPQLVMALEIVDVRLINVSSAGEPGNAGARDPMISGDGRIVAFVSDADNLVEGDTNGVKDIFLHDIDLGETVRVSATSDGSTPNGELALRALNADGTVLVYTSHATNIVPGDTNGMHDLFVKDMTNGSVTRINVATGGAQSAIDPCPDRDLISLVWADISDDGRFVAFMSCASDLVAGDTNSASDIFVHDRQTGETSLVSVGSGGERISLDAYGPDISADGAVIAFQTTAGELVAGDTNSRSDVFLTSTATGEVRRLSDAPDGGQQNGGHYGLHDLPQISDDKRYVVFGTNASNLVPNDMNGLGDLYRLQLDTGEYLRISENESGEGANSHAGQGIISDNGRFIAYSSEASNIVPPTTSGGVIGQAFLHDAETRQTIRISGDTGPGQANPGRPSMSSDGLRIVLDSPTRNLLEDAPAEQTNVYLIEVSDSSADDGSGGGGADDGTGDGSDDGSSDGSGGGSGDNGSSSTDPSGAGDTGGGGGGGGGTGGTGSGGSLSVLSLVLLLSFGLISKRRRRRF